MKFRLVAVVAAWLAVAGMAVAQTSSPNVQTFSLTSSAVSLPGGKSTVMANDTGATFSITSNFQLRSDNIVTPASSSVLQGAYFGGFNYFLPVFSTKLNNMSPNLNGARFHFYVTGSFGVDRVSSGSDVKQHYAALAGGGVYYDLTNSGSWTLGVEGRYAKLPGYANSTAIVSFGPSFHF